MHTPGLLAENTTGFPEPPPEADKAAEPPTVPEAGAVNEIDWDSFSALLTVIIRWTWDAGA